MDIYCPNAYGMGFLDQDNKRIIKWYILILPKLFPLWGRGLVGISF
jgi:hypothetical protein